jgi:hypothetical protein
MYNFASNYGLETLTENNAKNLSCFNYLNFINKGTRENI